MRAGLSFALTASFLLTSLAGCQTNKPPEKVGVVPVNSLTRQWALPLELDKRHDSIYGIYLRDNTLFAYSRNNSVTAIAADSGKPLWAVEVKPGELPLKPPVIVKEWVAFPAGSSFEVYALKDGKKVQSTPTPRSMRSPGTALGNTIYVGLDYPAGGRLAATDLSLRYATARWEVMTRAGISAAPAVYLNTIYFADENGAVFAVGEDKAPAWALERSSFETDGSVVADLRADEGGLYVASMDGKLYCLDTAAGRVRWQYYASVPLVDSPVATSDTVYQTVNNVGVVAIDKTQGKPNRDAKWTAKGATRFLSQDEKFVYLLGGDRRVMACDRATGEVKFRSQRNDFVAFATNTKNAMIFASTREGRVIGIMPVTKAGTVGTLVLAPVITPDSALAIASSR